MYAVSERLMVDRLVAHIGEVETGRRRGPTENSRILIASMTLGEACVSLTRKRTSRRDYPIFMGPPRRMCEAIRKDRQSTVTEKNQAKMLALGALMIEKRNFPTEVQNIQRRLEYETAVQLRASLKTLRALRGKDDEKRRGNLNGQITELTGLALMNYGDHPDQFGVFCLPHHKQMRKTKQRNRDAVFCHTADGELSTQALEIKLRCLDLPLCETGIPPVPDPRDQYVPSTALVSGHCDLGLKVNYETKLMDLTVPDLLVKAEFHPKELWSSERAKLQDLNAGLVFGITAESELEARRGRFTRNP